MAIIDAVSKSDNPDVLYGRDFDEEAIPIEEIIGEMGEVVIRGKIIAMDQREIRNERTILIFDVTDFTDTMTIKIFTLNEQLAEVKEGIKPGAFVKIKGLTMVDKFDGELTVGSIVGVKDFGFYHVENGSFRAQACGTALPHKNERYGRCIRGKGYCQEGVSVGTSGDRNHGSWRRTVISGCKPSVG